MSGIPEGTEHLRKIIGRWDADHEEDTQSLTELAVLLFQLDLLVADVKMYRSRLEQEFARRADTKLLVAEGIVAEVKPESKRKAWDHSLLASTVVERAMEEGEHPQDALIRCAGIGYWRKGEVAKLGLNVDNFCEVSYGAPHVQVRAKEEGE